MVASKCSVTLPGSRSVLEHYEATLVHIGPEFLTSSVLTVTESEIDIANHFFISRYVSPPIGFSQVYICEFVHVYQWGRASNFGRPTCGR